MYNRYVRSDDGRYERVPAPDPPPGEAQAAAPPPDSAPPPREAYRAAPAWEHSPPDAGRSGLLDRLLAKLHLENIDTGDLLLLVLLFLLFRDGEDEELLIALGLLLIL